MFSLANKSENRMPFTGILSDIERKNIFKLYDTAKQLKQL
jgi:hypothetical protein